MIELNKIYNEKNIDTMSRMPDGVIDLTVTSPPYDDLRDYGGNVVWNFDVFKEIAQELYRVTKQGGIVVWVVGDASIKGTETLTSFKQAIYFKDVCGFKIHDTMIYNKGFVFPDSNRYNQVFEYMFVMVKGKIKTHNLIKDRENKKAGQRIYGMQRQKNGSLKVKSGQINEKVHAKYGTRHNIWKFLTGLNFSAKDKIAFKHPAIFPEKLARDHIISWSNEGDLVYDPFGGSGTVAKMAHIQKRNWVLSEMDSNYCDIAQKRVQPYLDQLTMF